MQNANSIDVDNLRIEIAVLDVTIESMKTKIGKFKIPALMKGSEESSYVDNRNYTNRPNYVKSSYINNTDIFEIRIPTCYRLFFAGKKILKGTRFIVGFIGGDINCPKIIGLYDDETLKKFNFTWELLEEWVMQLRRDVDDHEGRIHYLERIIMNKE